MDEVMIRKVGNRPQIGPDALHLRRRASVVFRDALGCDATLRFPDASLFGNTAYTLQSANDYRIQLSVLSHAPVGAFTYEVTCRGRRVDTASGAPPTVVIDAD